MTDNTAPLLAFLTAKRAMCRRADGAGRRLPSSAKAASLLSFATDDDPNYFNLYCYMNYGDLIPEP